MVAEWPSIYLHDELKSMLSIYVDDFKMAGPIKNIEKGWKLLRSKIEMGDPTPVGLYLGCQQQRLDVETPQGTLGTTIYNMEAFFD